MKYLYVLVFLFCCAHALETPKASKTDPILSPAKAHLVENFQASFFPKVNPITGEYVEEETDLVVAGCQPLSFRRFYSHFCPIDPRYGWMINPEISMYANLQWNKSGLFAAIGEEGGSIVYLSDSQTANIDGRNISSYCLDKSNTNAYTNLGTFDPHNTRLYFTPENGNEGKSRFLGFVQDGSGRKREFYTQWHKWHKPVTVHFIPRRRTAEMEPQSWIPYQLIVNKEILPNGNIIRYGYERWQDELVHPSPQLVTSITAYNCDETKVLGKITLSYDRYSWIFEQQTPDRLLDVIYQQTVWEVSQYKIKGSNGKEILCGNSNRNYGRDPVYLNSVHNKDKKTCYNYTPKKYYLNSIDRGDGRQFRTEKDHSDPAQTTNPLLWTA
jgi:hypothetical protein